MTDRTAARTQARVKAALEESRRAAILQKLADAGHAPQVVPRPGTPDLVRVDCTCGAYRSAPGVERAALRAWMSHATRTAHAAGVTLP
jgi:hypothetical protein